MLKYANEFTVTGTGPVPVDMMRYDRCTPLTQEDAAFADREIHCLNHSSLPEISIQMIRFTEGNGKHHADHPATGRWNSFGWDVSNVSWRKLE
jgi:hypothetical protein